MTWLRWADSCFSNGWYSGDARCLCAPGMAGLAPITHLLSLRKAQKDVGGPPSQTMTMRERPASGRRFLFVATLLATTWVRCADACLSNGWYLVGVLRLYALCALCGGSSVHPFARSISVCVSTRVPAANWAGSEYSAGLWLMPLRQGTKIIPVGHIGTTN